MFDLITGRVRAGQCARSAEYTFAGKLAMEIVRHAADAVWLERRQQEAWDYPPPAALGGLGILDLSPWPNEETMIQVTFRIHQLRTLITEDPDVSELYELATVIVGQQLAAVTPNAEGHDIVTSEPDSAGTPPVTQPMTGPHVNPQQLTEGVPETPNLGALEAKHRTERINWTERRGTVYANGVTATLSQLRFGYKLEDLGEDLERMLVARSSPSKARSRWTRIRHLVMSLKLGDLISLRDGSDGHTALMDDLETEVNFLLKREKMVIRDLAGVVKDLRDSGLSGTELDLELGEQGLGDSLHDWGPVGLRSTAAHSGSEKTSHHMSTQRQISDAEHKVGWFCKDRLALDDIAGEAWKRLHFSTADGGGDVDKEVLAAILSVTRDLLRELEVKELEQASLIHEEWGEQWLGTYALASCQLSDPEADRVASKSSKWTTNKVELTPQVDAGMRSHGVSPCESDLECAVWHHRRDRASLDDLIREAEFRLASDPGDSRASRVRERANSLKDELISGRALEDDLTSTRCSALCGRDALRSWSGSYVAPPPIGFPLWREWGEDDPPIRRWRRRELRLDNGDISLGLDFRVRTAQAMSRINNKGMMDVIRETSLEGAPRSVIEGFALLSRSPYTLTKTLYVLWDMAVAMRNIRPRWSAWRGQDPLGGEARGAARKANERADTRGTEGTLGREATVKEKD